MCPNALLTSLALCAAVAASTDLRDAVGFWWRRPDDAELKAAVLACAAAEDNQESGAGSTALAKEVACGDVGARRFKVQKSVGNVVLRAVDGATATVDGDVDVKCFNTVPAFGREAVELVGEVDADGDFDGHVKVTYAATAGGAGDVVLHATARRGAVHGKAVFADDAGVITAGRSYGGASVGRGWRRLHDGVLVWSALNQGDYHSARDLDAVLLRRDDKEVLAGRFLYRQGLLAHVTASEEGSLTTDGCFLDVRGLNVDHRSDVTFSLRQMRSDSSRRLLETCNDFGGVKTGKEAIEWINSTYFSLQRDTLEFFSADDDGDDDEDFDANAKPLFSDLKRRDASGNEYTVNIGGKEVQARVEAAFIGSDGSPRGYGKVTLLGEVDGDFWFRPASFDGFVGDDGRLEGAVVVTSTDGGRFVSGRARRGALHGAAVGLGLRHVNTAEDALELGQGMGTPGVGMLARLRRGRPRGPVWVGLVGGGFLHGVADADGELTGDRVAFIYPDGQTALLGRFERGVMVRAREALVTGVRCSPGGIPAAEFELADSDEVFAFDPPDHLSFGHRPLLRDPLDRRNVEVAESKIPHSGQGVFARRDLAEGATVCYFAAMRFTAKQYEEEVELRCHRNASLSDEERRACTKYAVALESLSGNGRLDVPPWADGPEHYAATSGHKVNCAIGDSANASFQECDHPRFGLVLALVARRAIAAGEEVTVDYGYGRADFPADHPWYHKAKMEYERGIRREEL